MFRIQWALRQPPTRTMPRSCDLVGSGQFRTSQDFFVNAYQNFYQQRAHAFGPLPNPVRALGRIAGKFMRHWLEAMYESRRKQAMAVLSDYHELMKAPDQTRAPVSQMLGRSLNGISFGTGATVAPEVCATRIRCSITGAPCEGDRAYLCDEWGCARKAGLSPMSHENA